MFTTLMERFEQLVFLFLKVMPFIKHKYMCVCVCVCVCTP